MQLHIKDAAEDNLRFIRGAMARAERTSSHSGIGGIGMGVIALGAMVVASTLRQTLDQAAHRLDHRLPRIAAVAGGVASWFKARTSRFHPDRRSRSKISCLCLVPALADRHAAELGVLGHTADGHAAVALDVALRLRVARGRDLRSTTDHAHGCVFPRCRFIHLRRTSRSGPTYC